VKRFRFRLEKVLRARRLMADVARRDLGVAAQVRRRCEEQLHVLTEGQQSAIEELTALQASDEIDTAPVLVTALTIDRLGELIGHASTRVGEATGFEDEKRTQLALARRDMRVVEDLREKAQRAYRDECASEEMAEIEEMGLRRKTTAAIPGGES